MLLKLPVPVPLLSVPLTSTVNLFHSLITSYICLLGECFVLSYNNMAWSKMFQLYAMRVFCCNVRVRIKKA